MKSSPSIAPFDSPVSAAQLDVLNGKGFLLLSQAYSGTCVNNLLSALSDLPPAHAHRNLLDHPAVGRFAQSEEALRLITPALGKRAFAVRGIMFDKLPGANWKVPWHQDVSIAVKARQEAAGFGPWSVKEGVVHVQPPAGVLEKMLTLRLHLDDCFEENGPVRVLPGSHRAGILNAGQIERLRQGGAEVAAVAPAGGVLLMRPLLVHASSQAVSPSHRRVIHIEYAAEPLPMPLEWHAR